MYKWTKLKISILVRNLSDWGVIAKSNDSLILLCYDRISVQDIHRIRVSVKTDKMLKPYMVHILCMWLCMIVAYDYQIFFHISATELHVMVVAALIFTYLLYIHYNLEVLKRCLTLAFLKEEALRWRI